MPRYEYKVVSAPRKGLKAKGVKTPGDRFANALETLMNEEAAQGWEYMRADTLPCEEREGLMGRTTVFQNVLVFRRALATPLDETVSRDHAAPEEAPAPDEDPTPDAATPAPVAAPLTFPLAGAADTDPPLTRGAPPADDPAEPATDDPDRQS